MLRAFMLSLVMLLITLTSAHLGRDEAFLRAIGADRPGEQPDYRAAAPAKSVPMDVSEPPEEPPEDEPSETPEASEPSPASAPAERDTAPRFVLDAPLPDLPPLSDFWGPIDPSAAENASGDAPDDEGYIIKSPSGEEVQSVAEPYVRELYALIERTDRLYEELSLEAMREYLAAPPSQRAERLPGLTALYAPRFLELERRCDGEANRILARMTASLAAIGAPDDLAQDAKAAFQNEKQRRLPKYERMLSSLADSESKPLTAS